MESKEPKEAMESVESREPVEGVESVEPMDPVEPVEPAAPAEGVDPVELVDPALPLDDPDEEEAAGNEENGNGAVDEVRERLRAYRKKKGNRIMVGAAAALLLLVGFVLYQNFRHYSGVSLSPGARFLSEEGAEIINMNGYIVQYSRSSAGCWNTRGEQQWIETYDMQQPRAAVEGEVLAIADIEGYTVLVFDKEGLRGTISTERPIHSFCLSECGEVAVIMNETNATWIRLFSSTGREIAYLVRHMSIHGYPIAMAISPGGERLTISSLEIVDGVIKTDMAFHSFGEEGADKENNLLGESEFSGEVFPFTHFMDDDTFVAVSDSRLAYYNIGKELKNTVSNMISEEIRGIYYNSQYMGLLFTDTSGDHQYRLDLYDRNGDKKSSVGFTMDFTTLQIVGGCIYLNNDQELQIYTIRGREIFNGSIGTTVRAVIPSAQARRMTIVTESEIETLRLK